MAKDDAAKAAPRQKMLVFNAWASGERAELGLFVCLWPSCTACTGKAMAPTPVLLLENPRDGEPGGLLSMGSHRVGHD